LLAISSSFCEALSAWVGITSEASTFAQIANRIDTEISAPLNGKRLVRGFDGRTDTVLDHVVFAELWGLSFAKHSVFFWVYHERFEGNENRLEF
jgi:hypothetical protein